MVGFAGEGARRWPSRCPSRPSAPAAKPDRACATCSSCPAPRAERAVGLREGRRGLRPRLRVLRHPVVPRQAALAHARVDRGRGARPGRRRRRRARARRAGPRLVRARRRRARARSRRCSAASTRSAPDGLGARPPPLPLPERGARPARRDHARAADGRPVLRPLAAARRRRAPAAHEAVGERRPLPQHASTPSARRSPTAAFRSSFIVGFPGETEREHDELLAFLAGAPSSTGPGSSRSRPRTARPRPTSPTRSTPSSRSSGCASARRCRSRSPAPRATRSSGDEVDVLVDAVDDDGTLVGRTHREAPEIDGIVRLDADWRAPGRAGPRARHRGDRSRPGRQGSASVSAPVTSHDRVVVGDDAIATPANIVTIARLRPRRPDAAAHRRRGLHLAHVHAVVRARPPPTASTAGWRAATAPPARARSSTRWPTSSSCSAASSRSGSTATSRGPRWSS